MSSESQARKDAREFARSKMYYGEGAGTRRKLITATVEAKSHKDQAYARAFRAELDRQDMAEHAAKARRERQRKDTTEAATKNVKGLLTGNTKSVSTGVLVVATAGYFAHQTGLDRKLWDKTKVVYRDAREKFKARRFVKPHDNVYDITSIKKN